MNSNLIHRNDRTTFSSLGSLALRLYCLVFRLPTERLLNRQWEMRRTAGISLFIHQLKPFRTRVVFLFEDKSSSVLSCEATNPNSVQLNSTQTNSAPTIADSRCKRQTVCCREKAKNKWISSVECFINKRLLLSGTLLLWYENKQEGLLSARLTENCLMKPDWVTN